MLGCRNPERRNHPGIPNLVPNLITPFYSSQQALQLEFSWGWFIHFLREAFADSIYLICCSFMLLLVYIVGVEVKTRNFFLLCTYSSLTLNDKEKYTDMIYGTISQTFPCTLIVLLPKESNCLVQNVKQDYFVLLLSK